MITNEFALQAIGIEKSFGVVQVLKKVDFRVCPGEVHGLMGENGAGKSTLIKILTGYHSKDEGCILINGKEVQINCRQDAHNCGISVIYQELSVIDSLTVAQNICLRQEKTNGIFLSCKEMNENVKKLIDQYEFDLEPDDIVGTLSIAKRQTVEILKAISSNSNIIIMDEPTASLTSKECETLFGIIRRLRNDGKSIIYISHRLDEIHLLVDRLTVLRDGEVVGVREHDEINPREVIKMMIGREILSQTKTFHKPISDSNVLSVNNLSIGGVLRDVSFKAYGGQILGIGGLVGSGRTEILKSIFGLQTYDAGEILLNGKKIIRNPKKNVKNGIGFVPEDRRTEGIVQNLSIEKNLVLASLEKFSKAKVFIRNKKANQAAAKSMERIDIRPKMPKLRTMNLSGGNQQKVVLGKWLIHDDLKILLIDEPTVGIDVGAKEQIYSIMEKIASHGIIVITVSSDLQELITISDRIMVMYRGKVVADFDNKQITQEDILVAASGLNKEKC